MPGGALIGIGALVLRVQDPLRRQVRVLLKHGFTLADAKGLTLRSMQRWIKALE